MSPVSNTIHNERTKLTAGWLNTLASASIVAGGITPLVAVLYGIGQTHVPAWQMALASAGWIAAGLTLHWIARAILGRLKP